MYYLIQIRRVFFSFLKIHKRIIALYNTVTRSVNSILILLYSTRTGVCYVIKTIRKIFGIYRKQLIFRIGFFFFIGIIKKKIKHLRMIGVFSSSGPIK